MTSIENFTLDDINEKDELLELIEIPKLKQNGGSSNSEEEMPDPENNKNNSEEEMPDPENNKNNSNNNTNTNDNIESAIMGDDELNIPDPNTKGKEAISNNEEYLNESNSEIDKGAESNNSNNDFDFEIEGDIENNASINKVVILEETIIP